MLEGEKFSALSALLEAPPSPGTWRRLCQALEAWPDEASLEQEVLPALQQPLQAWDERARVAPAMWVERLLDGELVPHMAIVRTLDLRCQGLVLEDAELLAESPELEHITRLLLAYNGLQDEGTIALLNANVVRQVTHLDLAGNSVQTAGIRALAESQHMRNLRYVDLTGNWVSDEGAKLLANAQTLSGLETLVLRGNPIREEGSLALASSPYLCAAIRDHWRDR